MEKEKEFTEESLARMLISPFYAITIHPVFTQEHEPIVSEERWVKVNAKLMGELGAEVWLSKLLTVLKGGYVTSEGINTEGLK